MNTIIGGEFECCSTKEQYSHCIFEKIEPYTFSSGRVALYNIVMYCMKNLQCDKVILPDYLCDSIIYAIQYADLEIDFYHVTAQLLPDWQSVSCKIHRGVVILFIDYFGIIDNEPFIKQLKQQDDKIIVIKDLVQAPYHITDNSFADFQFTSFRKAFAVPDGSWVITKFKMSQPSNPSKFAEYKIAASYLKGIRSYGYFQDEIYLDLYSKGESLVGNDMNEDMSSFSKDFICKMDWERISLLRKRNTQTIIEGLHSLGITPIAVPSQDSIPLFIPISVQNRDKVRRKMFKSNIFLPIHWSIDDCISDKYKLITGAMYAKSELSIIVDQRYGVTDMVRILETLESALK